MIYIGIDPGASGGIALLDHDGHVVAARPMPETERDLLDVFESPLIGAEPRAVLERVWSSPQMGVASAFKFGVGVGLLRMGLTAAKIPFTEVTPNRWQKAMGIIQHVGKTRLGETPAKDKNIAKRRAQQLFPSVKVTHALADALLIADYCRRVELGLIQAAPETPRPARRRQARTELF